MSAPRIDFDLGKIEHNTRVLVDRLAPVGIRVTGVTKATLGEPTVGAAMLRGGAVGVLGLVQEAREPSGVDRVVGDLEGVAAGVGPQALGHGPRVPAGLERPTQASDVRLERGLHP